jgi:WD40 repeat protein
MLATGCRSGTVKICDLESQKSKRIIHSLIICHSLSVVIHPGGHKTSIRSIEYLPSSTNFLATAAVDGTAKVCHIVIPNIYSFLVIQALGSKAKRLYI